MKVPSPPVSPYIVLATKKHLRENKLKQHDIAAMFGINQGRVSEIKQGRYDYLINDDKDQPSLF